MLLGTTDLPWAETIPPPLQRLTARARSAFVARLLLLDGDMVRELGGVLACLVASGCVADVAGFDDGSGITLTANSANGSKDDTGFGDTFDASGPIDTSNPFFKSLGTNGRSCGTCHIQSEGWTITPAGLQARFNATGGSSRR